MIAWQQIDQAPVPGGAVPLRLLRRGQEYSIMLAGNELMNSRRSGSESAMAALTCARLVARPQARLLIGGLGMGFTLRAALAALGPRAHIDVVELVPAVLAWATGPLADIHGASLRDARVSIHEGDVGLTIAGTRSPYDAILLDVDNGPEGLSRDANDALYDAAGLRRAYAALTPGGVLAVWSALPDARFAQRLRRCRFAVEEASARAHGKDKGPRHVIWLATRPEPTVTGADTHDQQP